MGRSLSDVSQVAVLGAGVCGLYAARVLAGAGIPVTVVESQDVVGGLAAGWQCNGNWYDLGVHQLHAFDREIFRDVSALMGDRLIPSAKRAMIRYGDGYRRYPLEFADLLTGVPPWTLLTSLLGLAGQAIANRAAHAPPRNAEEALVQMYGRPLYEHFFRDFTHRYWGIPASGLSASFVRTKMPRLSAVDVVRRGLERLGLAKPADTLVESALTQETLYYSPTGSRELPLALAEYVATHGGEILLSHRLSELRVDGSPGFGLRLVTATGERELVADTVISTIPLPDLVQSLRPKAPAEVLDASHRLRYRALVVYGLLVRKPRVLDAQFVYFRERSFHRISEPANSGMVVQPPDHTVLLVELTCHVGDDRWQGGEATWRRIVADLEAEGLLIESDIVERHLLRSEHGYPVFEVGFEPHRGLCLQHIGRLGAIQSTGRQGAFAYPNMHEAMRMGAEAARLVIAAHGAMVSGGGPAGGGGASIDGQRRRPSR